MTAVCICGNIGDVQKLTYMKLLFNHTSQETAYLVEDYPYGFKLRCKIRYWLEYAKNKGVRFCSQTTNPKKSGEWNTPKKSTYSAWGGAMYLDENDYVQWSGLNEYSSLEHMDNWQAKFGAANHPEIAEKTQMIIAYKRKPISEKGS